MGETLEDGTNLGSIGETLRKIGVDLTDTTGELRNMGDVIEDLMVKWNDLTVAEKQAVAVKLAGKYQYNNLMALLENSKMYNEQLKASQDSLGTINEQQAIYMDSLEAKLSKIQSSFEGLINSIFNVDDIKPFIDELSDVINMVTRFVDSMGGGGTLAVGLGGIALSAFSNSISRGYSNIQNNLNRASLIDTNFNVSRELIRQLGSETGGSVSQNSVTYQYAQRMAPYLSSFDDSDLEQYRETLDRISTEENHRLDIYNQTEEMVKRVNAAYQMYSGTLEDVVRIENDRLVINENSYKDILGGVNAQNMNTVVQLARETSANALGNLNSMTITANNARTQDTGLTPERIQVIRSNAAAGLNSVSSIADLFSGEGLMVPPAVTNLRTAFEGLQVSIEDVVNGRGSLEDLQRQLRDVGVQAQNLNKDLQNLEDNGIQSLEEVQRVGEQYSNAKLGETMDREGIEATASDKNAQAVTQNLIDITGAVTQLAFAWESFQNLGSIWDNEDLSTGEKVLQTFMNLGPAIIMTVNSFQTLKQAMQNLYSLGQISQSLNRAQTDSNTNSYNRNTAAIEQNNVARRANAAQTMSNAAVTAADTAAVDAHTSTLSRQGRADRNASPQPPAGYGQVVGDVVTENAVRTSAKRALPSILSKVLRVGLKALPVIGTLLLVGDVLGSISKKADEAKKKAAEAKLAEMEEKQQVLYDTQSSYDSMEKLYKEYRRTGEASDSFKSVLKELGESLGINETNALLAAGAYDQLAEKVEKARQAAIEDMVVSASDAMNAGMESISGTLTDYINRQKGSSGFQWQDLWTMLQDFVVNFKNDISDSPFGQAVASIANLLDEIWNGIKSFIETPGKFFADILIKLADAASENDLPFFQGMADFFTKSAYNLMGISNDQPEIQLEEEKPLLDTIPYVDVQTPESMDAETESATNDYLFNLLTEDLKFSPEFAQQILDNNFDSIPKYDSEGREGLAQRLVEQGVIQSEDEFYTQSPDESYADDLERYAFLAEGLEDLPKIYSSDIATEAIKNFLSSLPQDQYELFYNEFYKKNRDSVKGQLGDSFSIPGLGKDSQTGEFYVSPTSLSKVNGEITEDQARLILYSIYDYLEASGTLPDTLTSREDLYKQFAYTKQINTVPEPEYPDDSTINSKLIDWEGIREGILLLGEDFADSYRDDLETTAQNNIAQNESIAQQNAEIAQQNEQISAENEGVRQRNQALESQLPSDRFYAAVEQSQNSNASGDSQPSGSSIMGEGGAAVSEGLASLFAQYASDNMENSEAWRNQDYRKQFYDRNFLLSSLRKFGFQDKNFAKYVEAINSGDELQLAYSVGNAMDELQLYADELKNISEDDSLTGAERDAASVALESVNAHLEAMQGLFEDTKDVVESVKSGLIQEFIPAIFKQINDNMPENQQTEMSVDDFRQYILDSYADILRQQNGDEYDVENNASYKLLNDILSSASGGLEVLADAAYEAGDAIAGDIITRASYQEHYADEGLTNTLSGLSDAQANQIYAALNSDMKLDSVNLMIQTLSSYGGNFYDVLQILTSGLLDLSQNIDVVGKDIEDLVTSGEWQDFKNKNFIEQTQNAYRDMVNANLEDNAITGTQISSALSNQPFVSSLRGADNQSKNFSDVLALTYDKSFESQRSIIEMNEAIQAYDYNDQIKGIQDTERQISNLEDQLQKINDLGRTTEIKIGTDTVDVSEAEEEIQKLKDSLEDSQFELEINVAGDLADKADQTIEAIKDIREAMDFIGEDYTVSPDNLEALVSVFPDILDNATLTADGLIQLDQNVANASIMASQSEIDAAIGSDSAKLNSAIQYAGAMAEQYQLQAETYAQMAGTESDTADEVARQKAEFDDQVASIRQDNAINIDDTLAETLSNEVDNTVAATQNQIDNSKAASDAAITNLAAIGAQSGLVAGQVISNARSMWEAVKSIGTDTFASGSIDSSSRIGVSTVSGSASTASINASGTSKKESEGYTPGSGASPAAQAAAAAQAQADAWNRIQGILQTKLLALGAAGVSVGNGIATGAGGGGGSGGGGYEPKQKEAAEDELDRYEKVDTLLDSINNSLSRLSDEQDRLIGKEYSKNLLEQVKLLQNQVDVEKEKLAIQKEEALEYQNRLKEYGLTFTEAEDGLGYIQNYKDKYKELFDYLNSLIASYNATTTEEGQEALDKQIEAAEKALNDYQDLVDKYDDIISNQIKTTQQEIEDAINQIEDLNIKVFTDAIESAGSLKEIRELLIDFEGVFTGLESDDPFRGASQSAERLMYYLNGSKQQADGLVKRLEDLASIDGLSPEGKSFILGELEKARGAALGGNTVNDYGGGYLDIQSMLQNDMLEQIRQFNETGSSSIFGENSRSMYDTAVTVLQNGVQAMLDFESEAENLQSGIIDILDDIDDRMQDRMDQYDAINDSLEHQLSLVEMLRSEESYGEINQILQAQQEIYKAQIGERQANLSYWNELLSGMQKGTKEYDALAEKIKDAQSELDSLIETSLENLRKQYENVVNDIVDTWTNKAFQVPGSNNRNDLEWVAQQWELINRNADYYLDDVNRAYEIQKLQGQYLEMLDASNTLDVQNKITEQMNSQLGYLRDKTKLSQYDVAYAQAQLDILQKQIALQEAQANKSQMKLRRDSQGNYSYVYTANENNVAQAQGDLLDAQNNAYNLSKEQIKQAQADALSAVQSANETIRSIMMDTSLTLDEQKERVQAVIDYLNEYLSGTAEQLKTSQSNILYDFGEMVDILQAENMTATMESLRGITEENANAFDAIDDRYDTSLTHWLDNIDEFNVSTNDMFNDLVDAANRYASSVDEVADIIGGNFNDMSSSIGECVDKTKELIDSQTEFSNRLQEDMGVVQNYESMLQSYREMIASLEGGMAEYKRTIEELQGQIEGLTVENSTYRAQIEANKKAQEQAANQGINGIGGSGQESGGGAAAGGGSGDGVARVGDSVTFARGVYYYDSWGQMPAGNYFLGQSGAVFIDGMSSSKYGGSNSITGDRDVHISSYAWGDLGWVNLNQLDGYDTGGYTGDWSDPTGAGRLALLHSKEIVLNKDDTDNILKAVEAVRTMTVELKNGAFESMISYLNKQGTNIIGSAAQGQIDQNIHITAEFPNATSADDIRQAILGLADQTVQYAHRK